jgi:hypothetical protein
MKEELGGKEKTTGSVSLKSHKVMAFGRMNPITSGHEAVVNKVHEIAKKHNADHVVIVSHSHDAKKNPLTGEQKVQHAKNAFPGTNVQSASKEHPTILHHAAQAHSSGAQHLHVVAGSDRHEEMHNLLHKYNGQKAAHGHYNFKSITVHSSGARDPDAEGTTGISASKMREHAASGNKTAFHAGAPSKMKPEHKDAMYNDVRKGMNIKEETVQEDLRPDMGAGAYINDFIKSTHPKFNNKSKEERRKMAIGAYMAAKARGVKEEVEQIDELKYGTVANYMKKAKIQLGNIEVSQRSNPEFGKEKARRRANTLNKIADKTDSRAVRDNLHKATAFVKEEQIDELSTELLGKYKTAAHANAKASDAAGNYAKGDKRFKGINKATNKQFDNDLKKHGQMKEGTLQGNIGGGDAMNTTTSAPSASTAKDTTMGKKIKGFKFFNGENDKQMNMNQPVKETYDDNRRGFGKRPREDDEYHVPDPEVKKAKVKKEEVEHIDEKSDQARRNKTYKNLMAASKGARVNRDLGMTPADTGHKNNQQMNKAIGRAVSRGDVHEMKTGNPGYGYHGQHKTEHDADEAYKNIHAHVKSLTDSDDKTVKHYLDSAHGRHLVGREQDHDYVKKDFKKFSKYYKPEMHEATAQKGVNVDDVNAAGQTPHEEKWEPVKKNVTKLKKVKEGNMKSYKEFVAQMNEYNSDESGVYRHTKKATYGTSYVDPEGADETAADMKKKEKKAAGRKTGQRTGSYKPRATMSKLKAAGSTYK